MERQKYTTKNMIKSYWKGIKDNFALALAIGTVATAGYTTLVGSPKEPTLTDYQKVEWKESGANPWNAYMAEKIPHNQFIWKDFQEEVEKKKSLEGKIMFPDLDKDGKVAQ